MCIALREITMENFFECIRLSVRDDQLDFVASNVYSLAEAKADGVSRPRAIYAGEQMVGFVMYDFEPAESMGYVTRLMVDARFQRHGYGREALRQVLEWFRTIPACQRVQISYAPSNHAAASLYASLGFEPTGDMIDGETVARLDMGSTRRENR